MYNQAAAGPAAELAPAELAEAKQALTRAENEFRRDDDISLSTDLAYIAARKAAIADAAARRAQAQQAQAVAMSEIDALRAHAAQASREELERLRKQVSTQQQEEQTRERLQAQEKQLQARIDEQREQLRSQREMLDEERERLQREIQDREQQLAETRKQLATQEQQLESARKERAEALSREQAAIESLKQVAQVKEEARGMVITLSGAVIFASGKSRLLPIAKQRLEQVAEALKDSPDQNFVVEGYTDSTGSDELNERLSQARADAVRDFLVQQGIAADRIKAVGRGEMSPVATNATAEGRAMNRRVEIVVKRDQSKEEGTQIK